MSAHNATVTGQPVRRAANQVPLFYRIPWKAVFTYLTAIIFAAWILLPFLWLVLTSFMLESEAVARPPDWIPQHPTLRNYEAFFVPSILSEFETVGQSVARDAPRALLNSAIVAFAVAIFNLIIGSFAGYAFARLNFRGGRALLLFYLVTRMVPGLAIAMSLYVIMKNLHLLDNLLSLILAYTTFTIPYTVWILQSYFRTIPQELEDAARVDRCNWLAMMWNVFLPIAVPGLVATAMFAFLSSWGEFLYALLFTQTMSSKTMPIILAGFITDQNSSPVLLTAGGVLAVIPPLILALLFQRAIVSGIAAGAVKG